MEKFPLISTEEILTEENLFHGRFSLSTATPSSSRRRQGINVQDAKPRELISELPQTIPFPDDALGKILGPAAWAIHTKAQCSIETAAQCVRSAAALASQGIADVILPTGEARPTSDFFLTIAFSGDRKTTAESMALTAVDAQEDILTLDREKRLKDPSVKKKNIPEPTLIIDEASYAGLLYILQHGRSSLGLFCSEGGQIFGGSTFKSSNITHTISGYSRLWDCGKIKQLRGKKGMLAIKDRRLSAHIMIQTKIANAVLSNPRLREQGFLSRFLVAMPESLVGYRLRKNIDPDAIARADSDLVFYETLIAKNLRATIASFSKGGNRLCPRTLPLSDDATVVWDEYADEVEMMMGRGGEFENVVDLVNKLPEHAARQAAVLTLLEDVYATSVPAEMMEAGVALCRYHGHQALRLSVSGITDPILDLAEGLLDWLRYERTDPLICLPEIQRLGPNRCRKNARDLVKVLEERGWLVKVPGGGVVAGTKRREVWRIIRP